MVLPVVEAAYPAACAIQIQRTHAQIGRPTARTTHMFGCLFSLDFGLDHFGEL